MCLQVLVKKLFSIEFVNLDDCNSANSFPSLFSETIIQDFLLWKLYGTLHLQKKNIYPKHYLKNYIS